MRTQVWEYKGDANVTYLSKEKKAEIHNRYLGISHVGTPNDGPFTDQTFESYLTDVLNKYDPFHHEDPCFTNRFKHKLDMESMDLERDLLYESGRLVEWREYPGRKVLADIHAKYFDANGNFIE